MTSQISTVITKPKRSVPVITLFILIGVVVVGIIILMGSWLKNSRVTVLSIGQQIPEFTLNSFSGETYRLSDLKGKVVLVNIWASWCTACDEESYMLQNVWEDLEPSDKVVFLGVDYVDTEKPALEYIQKHGITFPNGPDLASKISRMFRIQGVPESFLIDPDGVLKAIQIGPFSSEQEILDFIKLATD